MVVYFSGTGNSRYVAEALSIRLGERLVCANEFIKFGKTVELESETPFVFVSPTYSWRIPRIFSDFIERGNFGRNPSAYFVMTCGTDIGNAGAYTKELCNNKGFSYKGIAAVVMPENYVAMFDVTEKNEAEQIIAVADMEIKIICSYISDGRDFPAEKLSIVAHIKSGINPLFYRYFVKARGFRVTDRCIGCGKCEELCPLNNIRLMEGKPVYDDSCTHCMACICACPTEAIEYKSRTVGKSRYYNTKRPLIG